VERSAIDGWLSIPAVTNDHPSAVFATGGPDGWRLTDDAAIIAAGGTAAGASEWLSLSADGPCVLSFDWRVACEPGYFGTNGVYVLTDHLGLYVDDAATPVLFIDGCASGELTSCVYTNTAAGKHVYRWRYVKDDSVTVGADTGWLANVRLTPLAPESAEGVTFTYTDATGAERSVTVPKTWVDEKGLLPSGSTDYRAALAAPSGKTGAGGAALSYWHDYLAGTDPKDLSDIFRITSITVVNDAVMLTWSPDLRDAVPPRAYQVLGKARLDDPAETWAPTNAASRFFRVDVHLKE
jgi:hypothetical protein